MVRFSRERCRENHVIEQPRKSVETETDEKPCGDIRLFKEQFSVLHIERIIFYRNLQKPPGVQDHSPSMSN